MAEINIEFFRLLHNQGLVIANKVNPHQGKIKFSKTIANVKGIILPFGNLINEKLPNTLEIRRDIKKIINYTRVIAFLHQKNRKKIRVVEHGFTDNYANTEPIYKYHIIADLSDFQECIDIGKDVFSQTLNKVNNSTKEIIEIVKQEYEKSYEPINSADILKIKNIKQNHANELLRQAHTAGFLSKTKKGRKNKTHPNPGQKLRKSRFSKNAQTTSTTMPKATISSTSNQCKPTGTKP